MLKLWLFELCKISSAYMVAVMLEDNLSPPAHFAIQCIEKSQTSGAFMSKKLI